MEEDILKNSEMNGSKRNGIHPIIIAVIVCMVAIIGILSYMLLKPEKAVDNKGNLLVDESNLEDVTNAIGEAVEDGMFEVNMSTSWNFPDGASASTNAVIANGTANHYPITFEVILDEEIIYTSPVIPVGKKIKEVILEKDLDAGTYNAVCKYHLWKEDGTENSSFGVNIKLYIAE